MKQFSVEELKRLLLPHNPPCISLCMPTHRGFPGNRQDPIRLNNLIVEARRLANHNGSRGSSATLFEPLEALLDPSFWRHPMDGLAVFRAPDFMETYWLPMPIRELAMVSDTFHIKPLIRFLQTAQRFFLVVLSRKEPALYEGTQFSLSRIVIPKLGELPKEALEPERPQPSRTYKTAIGSRGSTLISRTDSSEAEEEGDLERFFRMIDDTIWPVLREERAPLIIAGVKHHHSLYRSITRYKHVSADGLEGSFDRATPDELHAECLPIVTAAFEARETKAIEEYAGAAGTGATAGDLESVARAAVEGRVARLLVARGAPVWGILDRKTGTIEQHDAQDDARDSDIPDDISECVLLKGGEVLVLAPERMPVASPVAAVLRW